MALSLVFSIPFAVNAITFQHNADMIIAQGIKSHHKAILRDQNGEEFSVNVYETPERTISTNLLTNTISCVKEFAVQLNASDIQPMSAGSKTETQWDTSLGVKGIVTIYYDRVGSTYKLTQVTGSWENHDAGSTLSNRSVIYACYDGLIYPSQLNSADLSSNTFNISTGYTRYANSDLTPCAVGCNSFVTISRPDGHNWQLITPNTLVGNFPSGM